MSKYEINEIKINMDIESKAMPDGMLERIRWATKGMPAKSLMILDKVDVTGDNTYTMYMTVDVVGNVDMDEMYDMISWSIAGMPGIKRIYRGD